MEGCPRWMDPQLAVTEAGARRRRETPDARLFRDRESRASASTSSRKVAHFHQPITCGAATLCLLSSTATPQISSKRSSNSSHHQRQAPAKPLQQTLDFPDTRRHHPPPSYTRDTSQSSTLQTNSCYSFRPADCAACLNLSSSFPDTPCPRTPVCGACAGRERCAQTPRRIVKTSQLTHTNRPLGASVPTPLSHNPARP